MRKLAKEFFISHSEIVDKGRCDGCGLLQVPFDYMIVGVHIGVRCTRVVSLHVVADPETPGRLADLRRSLRERLKASAACDTARLARHLERIYREALE